MRRYWVLVVNASAAEEETIAVCGYAGLPPLDHANCSKVTLFVKSRPVQDAKLSHATFQAYHTLLMAGRYPVAVILVRLLPAEVDVNVHPSKAEVRFRDPDAVFSAVQRAMRRALLDNLSPPQPSTVLSRPPKVSAKPQAAQLPILISIAWKRVGIARQAQVWHVTHAEPTADAHAAAAPTVDAAGTRQDGGLPALGQLVQTYILAEGQERLYFIDQHAAQLWERILARHACGDLLSQPLLDQVAMTFPAGSAYLLADQLDMLRT